MIGFDEPVEDVLEFLTLDAEFAWSARAAQGKYNGARSVFAARSADCEARNKTSANTRAVRPDARGQ